jgi:inorganic pyrophosphatase
MVQHPWHETSIEKKPPEHVNGIIEIPKGSRANYEVGKESDLIKLDRVIYTSMYYPLNNGFIPQTMGEDHDSLDLVADEFLFRYTIIETSIRFYKEHFKK